MQNVRFTPIVLILFPLLFLQCKSNLAQTKKSYNTLVVSKVGKPFEEKINKTETYSLAYAAEAGQSAQEYKYVVVRLKNNDVVLEGKFNRGGYVRWINDTMIEVLSIPKHITSVSDTSLYKEQIFLEEIR